MDKAKDKSHVIQICDKYFVAHRGNLLLFPATVLAVEHSGKNIPLRHYSFPSFSFKKYIA